MKRRRIAVASNGRFHVLDLARELHNLGHDVRFYSWVPRRRATAFGLPEVVHVNLLPRLAHVAAWSKYAPNAFPILRDRAAVSALNSAIIKAIAPCDEFIGMSGLTLEAAQHAKKEFGARIWMERGSQHIESQREILAAIPGAQVPTDEHVAREIACYSIADRITVPAQHVVRSFARDPAAQSKLFINPYGVFIERFRHRKVIPPSNPPTVLMVGGWSLRKGVDILSRAILSMDGVRLLHVGGIVDAVFPDHPRFEHHEPVDQSRLPEFYALGHVLALASREEGLALVQAQALASGLPIVCTERTGGADLAHTPELAARIRQVPQGDEGALRAALEATLTQSLALEFPQLSECARESLSWRSYGLRYSKEILRPPAEFKDCSFNGSI